MKRARQTRTEGGGRRRRGNLQKQRLPRGLQLRMHLSERGPWRLRGWLRFLPVCRNHLCVCVCVIHPPVLFIFSFSFHQATLHAPPDSPFVSTIDHSRGREHPCWIAFGCTFTNSERFEVVWRFSKNCRINFPKPLQIFQTFNPSQNLINDPKEGCFYPRMIFIPSKKLSKKGILQSSIIFSRLS